MHPPRLRPPHTGRRSPPRSGPCRPNSERASSGGQSCLETWRAEIEPEIVQRLLVVSPPLLSLRLVLKVPSAAGIAVWQHFPVDAALAGLMRGELERHTTELTHLCRQWSSVPQNVNRNSHDASFNFMSALSCHAVASGFRKTKQELHLHGACCMNVASGLELVHLCVRPTKLLSEDIYHEASSLSR